MTLNTRTSFFRQRDILFDQGTEEGYILLLTLLLICTVLSVLMASLILTEITSTSHLSVSRGFNVRVAFLTDDVVDVVQTVSRDAGKGPGTVWRKVAVGAPRAAKIRRTFDDHSCRSESLRKKRGKENSVLLTASAHACSKLELWVIFLSEKTHGDYSKIYICYINIIQGNQ